MTVLASHRPVHTSRARNLRILVLQHERETSLGAFATLLEEAGVGYEVVETVGGRMPPPAGFDGAIALGGSLSADDDRLVDARRWIRESVLSGLPFLGVCLGAQLLASGLGAAVERQRRPELGVHEAYLTAAARDDPLFSGLPAAFRVFGWHGERFALPRGAVLLAGSARAYQAFRVDVAAYGLQFHPEVRADAIAQWARLRRYAEQLDAVGASPDDVAGELARAAPELDSLARHLLSRWLDLASRVRILKRRLGIAA